jgi:Protein of unknown function DUF262
MFNNDDYPKRGENSSANLNTYAENGAISELDGEINEKYKKGEMRIVTEQGRIDLHSIGTILDSKQGDKKKYILNPEYQRRKRWNNRRKSLLIESFIMNVPIPPIFLYEIEYAVYEVMDGLQRLTAIDEFYKGKFVLEGLEYWQELNGRKYQDLPQNVKAGIDRRYLSSVILLAETAKDKESADFLKKIVFGRLNSGGEKLTPQELRNALFNGNFNQLCLKLAKNDIFRKLWHFPFEHEVEDLLLKSEQELIKEGKYTPIVVDAYRRMDDVELVLRFFAYNRVKHLRGSTLERFLDQCLKDTNSVSADDLLQLEQQFVDTITLIYEIFGTKAFVTPDRMTRSRTPTKMIYDPLMQSFAQHLQYKDQLLKHKAEIVNHIYKDKKLLERSNTNRGYIFEGKNQYVRDIERRIEYFNQFLQNYIH